MKPIPIPVIRSSSLNLNLVRRAADGLVRFGLGVVLVRVGLVAEGILRSGGAIPSVRSSKPFFSQKRCEK